MLLGQHASSKPRPSCVECRSRTAALCGSGGGWSGVQVPYKAGLALLAEGPCDGRDAANPWPSDRSTICTPGASILQLPQPTQADLTQLSR